MIPPPLVHKWIGGTCVLCNEALPTNATDDPLSPWVTWDRVVLRCSHYFHQSCVIKAAMTTPDDNRLCVICSKSGLDRDGRFMVCARNDGGWEHSFDLNREIDEKLLHRAVPHSGRTEAFLSFMSQMEFGEAEKYLKGEDENSNGAKLDPNVTYPDGEMTALHMAAMNNDTEGMQLLLRYGADKSLVGDGKTALGWARELGCQDAVALLSKP